MQTEPTSATRMNWRWVMIAGVIALAFLSGHWMQSQFNQRNTPPDGPGAIPWLPQKAAALRPAPKLNDRVLETRSPRSAGCAPDLQVKEIPNASLKVSLSAPCHGGSPVRFVLNELVADVSLDQSGSWEFRVPYLEELTTVSLEFGDYRFSHTASLGNQKPMQHVVLAWHGSRTFEIVAGQSSEESNTTRGLSNGLITRIGNGQGSAFEIHSFPGYGSEGAGVVRLSVEARVTQDNCNAAITITAYQSGFLGGLHRTDASPLMPDCASVGEVVRLQNLFRDMRLATH